MRLGQQVLHKIEGLLTRFEQPPPIRRQPRSPLQKGKQQRPNSFVKLYEDFKDQQQRKELVQKQKFIKEMKENSPFRITNKHTIFLNAQKERPPLHARLTQIASEKQLQYAKLREKYPLPPEISEAESQEIAEIENRRKNAKKFTAKEAEQKIQELIQRDRQRSQRLHMLRVKTLHENTIKNPCRPKVSQTSKDLWGQVKKKNKLSNSVFERFSQYEMERRTMMEKKEKEVKEAVTPFAPRISEQSRLLASRSSSRTNLMEGLSRSCSCKCFKRSRVRNASTAMHSSRRL